MTDSLEPLWLAMAEKQRRKAQEGPPKRGLTRRASTRKSHCLRGHERTPENLRGTRCRECERIHSRKFKAKLRAKQAPTNTELSKLAMRERD